MHKEPRCKNASQIVTSNTRTCRRRIKDHGRAEAMLIAAWRLGIRFNDAAAAQPTLSSEEHHDGEALSSPPLPEAMAAGIADKLVSQGAMAASMVAVHNGLTLRGVMSDLPTQPGLVLLNGTLLADAVMRKSQGRKLVSV